MKTPETAGHSDAEGVENGVLTERLREVLLRKQQTLAITGLTHATLYREMEVGRFPRPVHITAKAVAWKLTDIEAWMAGLSTAGRTAS